MSETKIVKCNKCQKEGLKWGTKQVKDKTYNILLEADGSEHRPYKDGKAECRTDTPQKPQSPTDKGQDNLDKSLTESNIVQALGKIMINLEARKDLEEKILLVLEQIRDKK